MMAGGDIARRVLTIAGMGLAVMGLMHLFESPTTDDQPAGANEHNAPIASTKAERIEKMTVGWSGEIAYGATYAALTPLSDNGDANTDIPFDPADDYWGLPRSHGVDLVAGYCGACHSLAIVMQQRQTTDGWTYLLDWMEEKQGMAPIAAGDRAAILAYLAREFGGQ